MRNECEPVQIRENRIELLTGLMASYLQSKELRCYKKYINGKFLKGYAMTFKIIEIKKEKRK
jgi:hypothetical protein